MRSTWFIFRREVGQYFSSPLAYIMAFAFLLITGLIFNNDLLASINRKPVDPSLIPQFMAQMLVLFAPLFTMRLISEETREGTIELLLTAPISDQSIVFGKFLSAWFYYTFLLALTFIYQIILLTISSPDLAHTIGAYLGVWLYGGATLAIGLLFSATTDSQILAAFLSTSALTLLYLGDIAGEIVSNIDIAQILRNLTLAGHFTTSFAIGLIRLEDIIFYCGIIVIALYITIRLIESRRWR